MAGAPVVTSSGTATEEVVGDAGICVDPLDHAAIQLTRSSRSSATTKRARAGRSGQGAPRPRSRGRVPPTSLSMRTGQLRDETHGGSEPPLSRARCRRWQRGIHVPRVLRAVAAHPEDDLEFVLFASESFAAAYPDIASAFVTKTVALRPNRVVRVAAESTWLARASRGVDAVHHMGGRVPAFGAARSVVTVHDLQPLHFPRNSPP